MERKRIPTEDFSKNNEDLIFQIRWLLNEMGAALVEIELGNTEEAKKILKKEVEESYFLRFNK